MSCRLFCNRSLDLVGFVCGGLGGGGGGQGSLPVLGGYGVFRGLPRLGRSVVVSSVNIDRGTCCVDALIQMLYCQTHIPGLAIPAFKLIDYIIQLRGG